MDLVYSLRDTLFPSHGGENFDSTSYKPLDLSSLVRAERPTTGHDETLSDKDWLNDCESVANIGNFYSSPVLSDEVPFAASIPGNLELSVETQPPADVRTRTPSENRTFSVSALLFGDLEASEFTSVKVELVYANSNEKPPSRVLGGVLKVDILSSATDPVGHARFSSLTICEASTKHNEREFQLQFLLVSRSGKQVRTPVRTSPFYAYSNQKVLARRRNIEVRCLSSPAQAATDSSRMHVVGKPFIPGPSFSVLFSTPIGVLPALNLEIFSESVAFFTPPSLPPALPLPLPAEVTVTNDGRTFSTPLPFSFT